MSLLATVWRVRGAPLLALMCALSMWFATPLQAQLPPQLRVRWLGAQSCARDVEFDRELTRLLGADAHTIESGQVELRIDELADDGGRAGYRLRLQLEVAEGKSERVLELASCAELRHAAALLVATALEHRQPTSLPAQPAVRRPRDDVWHVRLGLLADLGTLPAASAGPSAGLGWERGRFRLAVQAHYLFAREASDSTSRLVAEIDQFAAALGVAYLWTLGPVRLGPTLDAELGVLRARARGEQGSPEGTALWGTALVGALAELPTGGRLTLALSLQLSLPPWPPTFSLAGEEPFYETAALGFRAGLAARVRLGFKNEPVRGQ